MPELPEVETIRRQLMEHIPLLIEKVHYSKVASSILKTKSFSPKGKTIIDIGRKGKVLDFIFKDEGHIISGLGMSGSWQYSHSPITQKHAHINFTCKTQTGIVYISYVDPRRFGRCHFVNSIKADELLGKLGVDISTRAFNASFFRELCKRFPKRKLKPFLLEQKHLSGVGNYIACEMCALSHLHPSRELGRLTDSEINAVVTSAKKVLKGSLKRRGLTFAGGYTDATGQKGEALSTLVVFHQQMCGICETTEVKKIQLQGRSTFYCPNCQH